MDYKSIYSRHPDFQIRMDGAVGDSRVGGIPLILNRVVFINIRWKITPLE